MKIEQFVGSTNSWMG
ncbi:hypothetical protein LINPERPRIM_LOCUS26848 [Linum perenne]